MAVVDTEAMDGNLAAALLGLKDEERNLLLLFAWAELTYEQLAEALQLPIGTVRSRLARTRAKVRATLEPALATGGEMS